MAVSSSILISNQFFWIVLFALAQVGAAEWLRRIVDFIENPNQTVQKSYLFALIAIALIRGIGFYLQIFLWPLFQQMIHIYRFIQIIDFDASEFL